MFTVRLFTRYNSTVIVNTKISKINFAKLAGVGRAAVTLGVQRGNLVSDADGFIDTAHPVNAAYLAKRQSPKPSKEKAAKAVRDRLQEQPKTAATQAAKPKPDPTIAKAKPTQPRPPAAAKPKKPREPKLPEPGEDLPDDPPDLPDTPDLQGAGESIGELSIEKIKAEIKYKTEAAEAYRIKRLERLGLLVEREHVRQTLGRFNAELRIRLLEMPGTITPRLIALARAGAAEHEVIGILEDEIARAVDNAKATVDRAGLGES